MLDPLLASFRSDFPAKQTRFIVFVNDYLNDESFLTTTRRSVMSRIISNQASNHFLRWREATNMSTMIPPSPKRLWRKGTSKRAIGPDVSPKKGRLWRRKCAEKPKSSINKPQGINILTSLPHEVLLSILSFLSVLEVDECAKLVCESLRRECNSKALWQFFCDRTGKLNIPVSKSIECTIRDSHASIIHPFREHYYMIPCVPVDFASVTAALRACPIGGTITLLPGVYEERVNIRKSVHIRAAFPERGAAIVWYKGLNDPCVAVGDFVRHDEPVEAQLSNVQLLHSTMGSDIWGGNCAILVEGRKSRLRLTSCSIQSESGRGVVATNGSFLEMKEGSVIHDCAATGLYLGDNDSVASISGCNIIRNGGGSRRPLPTEVDNFDGNETDRVPPGHSGVYVEAGRAFIENSLVAGNSLTGVSIVRGGGVMISGCDVTENGSEAILVEESFETRGEVNRRPIGVEEGPAKNTYSSRSNDAPSLQDVIHSITEFGGMVRQSQFEHIVTNKLMSTKSHESRYR